MALHALLIGLPCGQASTASQQAIEQKLKIGKEKKKISIF
jgi:hypothetical protein